MAGVGSQAVLGSGMRMRAEGAGVVGRGRAWRKEHRPRRRGRDGRAQERAEHCFEWRTRSGDADCARTSDGTHAAARPQPTAGLAA